MPTPRDAVDAITDQWAIERPDVDVGPMAVVGRISRAADELHARLQPVFAAEGLTRAEFDLIATLRRHGAPHVLSPGDLLATAMITSGGLTKRVARLERAGLVERTRDPADGRGVRVALTPRGVALADRLLVEHMANEERLLAGLSERDRDDLVRLLRKLLGTLPD